MKKTLPPYSAPTPCSLQYHLLSPFSLGGMYIWRLQNFRVFDPLPGPPCLHFGPIHSTKFMQPPFLYLLLGCLPPPSHCRHHMYLPPYAATRRTCTPDSLATELELQQLLCPRQKADRPRHTCSDDWSEVRRLGTDDDALSVFGIGRGEGKEEMRTCPTLHSSANVPQGDACDPNFFNAS